MIEIPTFKFALQDGLDDSFLPTKATKNDTGWDVRCAEPNGIKLYPFNYAKISLGFKIFAPSGWWISLKPRSSSFIKKQLHALYGTIDEEFPHVCMFCCQYIPDDINYNDLKNTRDSIEHQYRRVLTIEYGERIGQIIPVRRQEMVVEKISNEELEILNNNRNSERNGGFGSSDLVKGK
jgi:dUTPase